MTPEDVANLPYRPCVGLCLTRGSLVWAGERIDTPGAWQMPQGGIDKGETPEVAALRELGEETSLSPDDVRYVGQTPDWLTYDLPVERVPTIWKGRYRGQKQLWFRYEMLADDSAVGIETEHPEFARWQWMDGTALIESIVPFKRDIYRAVLSEFGLA